MKKKVLIIGAGQRVRAGLIPALLCLPDKFEIIHVYSRSPRQLRFHGGRTAFDTITSLDQVAFATVDLIVLCVTDRAAGAVLSQLSAFATGHIDLLVDTPVLVKTDLWALGWFVRYRRVLALEDNIALPPFRLARRLIAENRIGPVRRIWFFHNGHKHHAAASLRTLLSGAEIVSIRNFRFEKKFGKKAFSFRNGATAFLQEPRDFPRGRFLIEGDRGRIADYDLPGRPVDYRIGYRTRAGLYDGLELNGRAVEPAGAEQRYLEGVDPGLAQKSLMAGMKVCALVELFLAVLEEASPFHYDPREAIADRWMIDLCEGLGYFHSGLMPIPRMLAAVQWIAERGRGRIRP